TVDGCVVEVGAELAHGVLRVLAHEHLSAEPDDRLAGLAVPIVLIALAVELDHPRGVRGRPEDVVVEEAVTVVGGLLGDLGAAELLEPPERGLLVERGRGYGDPVQGLAERTLPPQVALPPQAVELILVLHGQTDAVADVLPEPRIVAPGVAAAHDDADPPL